jgi:aspartate beta-hydroxylase
MSNIEAWAQAATAAVNRGQWHEAERLWRQVLAADPRHPQALFSIGVHAYRRGALDEAVHALRAASTAAPGTPVILLSLGVALRDHGDAAGELDALNAALAADPYFLPALLAKGSCLERTGRSRAAAETYRNALQAAPPKPRWPDALRAQLQHALEVTQRYQAGLAAYLREHAEAAISGLSRSEAERWREAISIASGQSKPYVHECNRLHVPRLPAIPFFDRDMFPWVDALEAETETIREELSALLSQPDAGFKPYVAYAPGTPVNQWDELNHSQRWSSYFLWRNGEPVEEAQARCPRTVAALSTVEMADIPGLCPNAMFSALAPHTHIPPHTGETNARLVVHLPLIVPAHCRYRVGFEQREWKVGEVLIFDDSIEHEARNDSDELRVVLIFDVWNPLLSEGEREMVRTLTRAKHAFDVPL